MIKLFFIDCRFKTNQIGNEYLFFIIQLDGVSD